VFAWPDGSHDLRQGWASHAITAGVDASTVSGGLGHHSPAFTMATYVHSVKDAEKRAAETMGAVLIGA
jgi:integrase